MNPIAAERSPAAVQRAVLKRKRSPLEPCVGVSSRLAALRRALLNLPIYRRNEWGMLQIRRGGASCAADPPRKGEPYIRSSVVEQAVLQPYRAAESRAFVLQRRGEPYCSPAAMRPTILQSCSDEAVVLQAYSGEESRAANS